MTPTLAPFADPLPVPERLIAARQNGQLSVPIRAGVHRFHRDLPESAIWGYGGTVPGPTIEAERGQPVTVQWRNELDSALPVVVTTAPHLTPAPYDGWAENLCAPGQDAVFHYPLDQRATLLWYHDHVMGVTKFGVYAGLAGLWIVRDQRERELGLPEGPPFDSAGSLRSAPTTGCSGHPLACRRTGWCSPRPSAPTCSSTSPAWRLAPSSPCSTRTTRYQAAAAHFEDATTFFPVLGRDEV